MDNGELIMDNAQCRKRRRERQAPDRQKPGYLSAKSTNGLILWFVKFFAAKP
jgi:hypothetical protein